MPRSIEAGSAFNIFTQTLCLVLVVTPLQLAWGQQQSSPASPQQPAETLDTVFRVTADLVQADVIVEDRQGRLVDNLQREEFELRVDDRPQGIAI
jgi:hypothetical protein